MKLTKPNFWNAHIEGNAEIQTEIESRKMIFAVSEHTKANMDKITVLEFYSLMDFLEEKHSKNG